MFFVFFLLFFLCEFPKTVFHHCNQEIEDFWKGNVILFFFQLTCIIIALILGVAPRFILLVIPMAWLPPMLRAPRLVPSPNMFRSLAGQTPGQRTGTVPDTVLTTMPHSSHSPKVLLWP